MIITRYLTRQILQVTAALSFILLVVAVLGRLLKYLAQASQGELDPGVLFLLLSYRLRCCWVSCWLTAASTRKAR
jgi:lipopolysaccharide export system permease protein